MATTAVTTRGEVHGTATMAQIVPPRQVQAVPHKAHAAKATAQASHSRASRTEQPAPVTKPAPAAQPAPKPAPAAQPAPMVSQAAQLETISTIRTNRRAGSNFTTFLHGFDIYQLKSHMPGINHPSIAQGGIFLSKLIQFEW